MPRQTFMMVEESEWRSGNHISISKPLWALFVDVHDFLSIRAIGRKSWHAENVFSCNVFFIIITNKLRFYLCIRWIHIWLYIAILVMALLILNSFKAFDSWRVKIIIFKQKGTIETFKWRNGSECSYWNCSEWVDLKIRMTSDIIFSQPFQI